MSLGKLKEKFHWPMQYNVGLCDNEKTYISINANKKSYVIYLDKRYYLDNDHTQNIYIFRT